MEKSTQLLQSAADRARRYLTDLQERGVAPTTEAVDALRKFHEPLPQGPSSDDAVLQLLDEVGSPATLGMAGPRFFGFVIGGALSASLAANWLAGAWDQNTAYLSATPATSTLELVAEQWLVELFGLHPDTVCGFVTGATVANFTALAAARQAVLARAGWDVEADGLFGAPEITVVVGEEAHPTLLKSIGLLGLGRNRLLRVPVDSQGRMRPKVLPGDLKSPAIICAQAGNVNTGAVDPLQEIVAFAGEKKAWLHVDAAFGLWARAEPTRKHLLDGIESADSCATDAHKWLNVPYDCGLAFVRHKDALRAAMAITAEYLPPPGDVRNPADYTPELSRRARGVEVWAALKSLGRSGVAELVARTCTHAQTFAQELNKAGFEILNEVVLNQVLVSFGPAESTRRVIKAIQKEGTCWCGVTEWQGRTAMRISVSSWATTEEDVARSVEAMVKIARQHNS